MLSYILLLQRKQIINRQYKKEYKFICMEKYLSDEYFDGGMFFKGVVQS